MSAKLVRWVDLVAALLARRFPLSFTEIAAEVPAYAAVEKDAARVRMFERDKAELRAMGVPIETDGVEGSADSRYRLRPGEFYLPYLAVQSERGLQRPRRVDRYGYHAMSEMTFGAEELGAVADAARRVRQLGDPDLAREAESAMRKLAFDLPLDVGTGRDDEVVIAEPMARSAPEMLRVLAAAIAARKRMTIEYFSMTENAASTRTVDAYGLFFVSGHWYLAAAADGAVRNYRVSRIRSAKANPKAPGTPDFQAPAEFRLKEHARSRQAWELGDAPAVEALVELAPHATGAARAAFALGAEVDGDATRRRFAVRRADVFARWVMSFGGELCVTAPRSMAESVAAEAGRALALYA